jgi:hypothetical protein
MLNNNIFRCNICNKHVIYEEIESHDHSLKNILFDTNGTFSLDGKKWYKFSPTEIQHFKNPSTDFQQRKKTTDDETEPKP